MRRKLEAVEVAERRGWVEQVEGPEGQLVREMVGFVGVVVEEEEVWEVRGVGFLAWRVRWAFGEGMEVW